ncbi:hypothetical protein D3C77_785590 [compost metagenome]
MLIEHIGKFFKKLENELANDQDDTFTLEHHGPIILLEAGDDLQNLNYTGLYGDILSTAW